MSSLEDFFGGFYQMFKEQKSTERTCYLPEKNKEREHLSTHYLMPGLFLFQSQINTI